MKTKHGSSDPLRNQIWLWTSKGESRGAFAAAVMQLRAQKDVDGEELGLEPGRGFRWNKWRLNLRQRGTASPVVWSEHGGEWCSDIGPTELTKTTQPRARKKNPVGGGTKAGEVLEIICPNWDLHGGFLLRTVARLLILMPRCSRCHLLTPGAWKREKKLQCTHYFKVKGTSVGFWAARRRQRTPTHTCWPSSDSIPYRFKDLQWLLHVPFVHNNNGHLKTSDVLTTTLMNAFRKWWTPFDLWN